MVESISAPQQTITPSDSQSPILDKSLENEKGEVKIEEESANSSSNVDPGTADSSPGLSSTNTKEEKSNDNTSVETKEEVMETKEGAQLDTVAPDSSGPNSSDLGEWEQILDEASGAYYYYNHLTGESTWDSPFLAITDENQYEYQESNHNSQEEGHAVDFDYSYDPSRYNAGETQVENSNYEYQTQWGEETGLQNSEQYNNGNMTLSSSNEASYSSSNSQQPTTGKVSIFMIIFSMNILLYITERSCFI